ncbi:hypothetical protein HELRODRAFT_80599, partial [Helobdella robusta]|uniref:F5/8 type C domain-containing protein n=1 Tax=Helobdella robusta TaxID=6412 RepID=T1G426_HELRO
FEGNTDSYTVKHIYLDDAIVARYIKFHTTEWHKHPSLKVEIIGCQVCKNILSLQPNAKVTSSSTKMEQDGTCGSDDAYIVSNGAWCARNNDDTQWLQFDVGPPTLITGLITKGRSEGKKRAWVTNFKISFSNDSNGWHYYSDSANQPIKRQIFQGNNNANDTSYNYLNKPFTARFIRFHPISWVKQVAMRAAVIGCPFDGNTNVFFVFFWYGVMYILYFWCIYCIFFTNVF